MTREEIVTDVRKLLAQTDSTNSQHTDNEILTQIFIGYRDFVRLTGALESTEDITSVADQVEYSFAGSYSKISQVRYIDSSGDIGRKLQPYPGGDNNLPEKVTTGIPTHYVIRQPHTTAGQKLVVWPVCAEDGKTIRCTGYEVPGNLTNGSSPLMHESYHVAISFYATWKLLLPYSHKSALARAKTLDLKREYYSIVEDAITVAATDDEDANPITLDVY